MLSSILLFTLNFCLFLNVVRSNDLMSFVRDFVESENEPSFVVGYLCWTKNDLMKFSKMLSKSEIPFLMLSRFEIVEEDYQVIVVDMECENAREMLFKAEQEDLFTVQYRWVILNVESLEDLKDFYFSVESKVYVFRQNTLSTLYKFSSDYDYFVEDVIAEWSNVDGLHYISEYLLPRNRSDLMGLKLNISYVVTNPDSLKHLEDYRYQEVDSITKNSYNIIKNLVIMMNITAIPTWRNTWGYLNETSGLYDGLIGDLQTGRSELGGTSSFLTLDRLKIIEYTASPANTFMKFLFRKPPLTYVTNVFTLPFDTYVWIACFIVITIGMLITYIIVYWEFKDPIFQKTLTHMDFISPLHPNVSDICITQVGWITQQGGESEPKSGSGRIASIFLMISLMFLYCAYSANIVALLQFRTDSIRTVQDLMDSRIKLGVEDIVYSHHYFKSINEPFKKAIYEQKIAPKGQQPNFMTIEQGVERLRREFFAFHVEMSRAFKIIADTFHEHEKCSLSTITFFTNIVAPYLQVRKKSVYRKLVKVNMRKIQESGVQHREFLKIYMKKPACHETSSFESVGLIDCYAAFMIIGIGIMMSIIFNIVEILHFRYSLRRATKNVDDVVEFLK